MPLCNWISKFFDTIPWQLVLRILADMGAPEALIILLDSTWKAFRRHYQVGKTVGPGSAALRGFPQGCPLSPILSLLALVPLLRYLHTQGADASSFADDMSLAGYSQQLFDLLPKIDAYVTGLGMTLNAGKTGWIVNGDIPLGEQVKLQEQIRLAGWGTVTGACGRALGANLRTGTNTEDAWQDLQGTKEVVFRARLRRARLIQDFRIRILVAQSLTSAMTYGAGNEFSVVSCTQGTARAVINTVLATNNTRVSEEVFGTVICKGHLTLPTWASMFELIRAWLYIVNSQHASIAAAAYYSCPARRIAGGTDRGTPYP